MCLYIGDNIWMVSPKYLHSFIQQAGDILLRSVQVGRRSSSKQMHWNIDISGCVLPVKGLAAWTSDHCSSTRPCSLGALALGFNALQSLSWNTFIFVSVFYKGSPMGRWNMHSELGDLAPVWSCLSPASGDRFSATCSPTSDNPGPTQQPRVCFCWLSPSIRHPPWQGPGCEGGAAEMRKPEHRSRPEAKSQPSSRPSLSATPNPDTKHARH